MDAIPPPPIRRSTLLLALAFTAACSSTPLPPPSPPAPQSAPGTAPPAASDNSPVPTKAVDLHGLPDLAAIIPQLAENRVVFVGEAHTEYAHHLNQLAIIRGLHERHLDLAIGLEYFQHQFQKDLDAYSAGRLTETELLANTQYFKRWGYDFRLYEPILKYARDNNIPLLALNVSSEITQKVAHSGLSALTEQERAEIPEFLDRSNSAYRAFLESVFKDHPQSKDTKFESFFEVQLLWDEGMADRAARYLENHPGRTLVVLAGSDHVRSGFGIPDRLTRRLPVSRVIVLNGLDDSFEPGMADIALLAKEECLPPAGTLGISLEPGSDGLRVTSILRDSAAQAAGLARGDQIVSLNGERVREIADVKLLLWDKQPGTQVTVDVKRRTWFLAVRNMLFAVTLR